MLRISRLTDYGLLLLAHFARFPQGQLHNARDLAAEVDLPLPTVSKLLKHMTRANLLVSTRGAAGGYTLARPPQTITVAQTIDALEGPISFTACTDGEGQCDIEDGCANRSNMILINRAIRGALTGITIADLAKPMPARQFVTLGPAPHRAAPGANPTPKVGPAPADRRRSR